MKSSFQLLLGGGGRKIGLSEALTLLLGCRRSFNRRGLFQVKLVYFPFYCVELKIFTIVKIVF